MRNGGSCTDRFLNEVYAVIAPEVYTEGCVFRFKGTEVIQPFKVHTGDVFEFLGHNAGSVVRKVLMEDAKEHQWKFISNDDTCLVLRPAVKVGFTRVLGNEPQVKPVHGTITNATLNGL